MPEGDLSRDKVNSQGKPFVTRLDGVRLLSGVIQ